ncbi:hypothetical protein [Rubritalea sp.]|uniref:hypothetical protein n=1 Tax=Rubritalea sp. TaxID=2109375 RepID=UPI003EF85765
MRCWFQEIDGGCARIGARQYFLLESQYAVNCSSVGQGKDERKKFDIQFKKAESNFKIAIVVGIEV